MEFFEGWKVLTSRLDAGDLPARTQLVGFKLFAISNELRFPEIVTVSDRELMKRTGIQSGHTIHEARKRLRNAGLLTFETQLGKPTKYHWTLEQGSTKEALSKHQGSTKEAPSEIPINACAIDVKTLRQNQSIACEKVEELDELLDYWGRDLHGGRLSFEHQSILSAHLKERGLDWLKAAMKEAADANNNPRGLSPKFLFGVIARKAKAQPSAPKTTASRVNSMFDQLDAQMALTGQRRD